MRNLAFEEAKKYPPIEGDTVRSTAFPDYLGKLIKIRDDGNALVDFDEIGVRIVPFDSCIDVDLALQFIFAQERGIPLSYIDVAAFQEWSREENRKIEAREREKMLNKNKIGTDIRRGRYSN